MKRAAKGGPQALHTYVVFVYLGKELFGAGENIWWTSRDVAHKIPEEALGALSLKGICSVKDGALA